MDDSQPTNSTPPDNNVQPEQPHESVLNQTFGEVLQNKEAQEKIMKAMHIGPEQLQELLKTTENNPLTNMTMGQLFKSGFVQKAVEAQGGKMPPEAAQIASQGNREEGLDDATSESASNVADENMNVEQAPVETQLIQEEQLADPSAVQAAGQEMDTEQFSQMVDSGQAQVLEADEMGNPTKIAVQQPQPQPKNESVWDIIKGIFK
jgi:hypothetical protein